MQVKFKAKEKGEQLKLFTQPPHCYKYFTKHLLEKHLKIGFFCIINLFSFTFYFLSGNDNF